ncbi:glycosyltransferase family 4 protein [Lamprobacter modestohalophilus]|uniref:glycosyltransferase family 4 protein n=1 Tax=Lamprobacter modestohalophilus TaxID=1064514 RepID=UPI002ADEF30A|nr:glycosyltransferase family 4 protein [Lamprobacter modestohalophilus]MEA1052502.1 glycosyltransferase family 4 protein [Lamprobacter modestohalophilus]
MRIAIVHFHLQTGGVTRVIQHACAALASAGHSVVVLSGEPPQPPGSLAARVEVVSALGYEERRPPMGASALQQAMEQAAARALGGPPDLWHIHNHCLGKNLALPEALRRLAEAGHRLLLQPHDFAEDGRPALYQRMLETIGAQDGARLSAFLYPVAPQIHYATLNQRDYRFLAAAGVPSTQLHRLPNAVSFAGEQDRLNSKRTRSGRSGRAGIDHRRWLYPTRAIRRKNLGELLFWAALAGPDERFATTLAPQNPTEQPIYQRWVALAQELALPVDLALGAGNSDFGALLASSHALMTTSVAEGFGLAFLEPWLIGRPLAGRDLPEITADFRADGLDLSGLYQRLPVPLDWLDAAALRRRLDQALAAAASAYGREREADDLQRAWHAAVDEDGRVDFGRLDEDAQTQVLRHVCADPAANSALDATSPPLTADAELIARNQAVVEREYLIDGYRLRLEAIYQSLLNAPATPLRDQADGQALIARFQAPERLHLLRT